jgi:hypothetical protein
MASRDTIVNQIVEENHHQHHDDDHDHHHYPNIIIEAKVTCINMYTCKHRVQD